MCSALVWFGVQFCDRHRERVCQGLDRSLFAVLLIAVSQLDPDNGLTRHAAKAGESFHRNSAPFSQYSNIFSDNGWRKLRGGHGRHGTVD